MNANQKSALGALIAAVAAAAAVFIPGAGPIVAMVAPIVSAVAAAFGILVVINNQPGK